MENTKEVSQVQSGLGFTYYCQGYYFSFGYFAFTNPIEYWRSFVKDLNDDPLGMQCIS